MRVRILGPVRVTGDDGEVALSPQLRRLLCLFVVADGDMVSADRITEYIADGDLHGSKVRTAVSRLRKVVGDRVQTVAGGWRLTLTEEELDAAEFEYLRTQARVAIGPEKVALLTEAQRLWRGPALDEVADLEWAAPTAARLDAARAALTEDLAEAYNAVGRFDDAIELLETHLVDNPYRERPMGLLMRALAGAGRLPDALKAYHRFRVTLRDETGLDPSSELRSLEGELLAAHDAPEAPAGRAATTTAATVAEPAEPERPGNLPEELTSFVGRDRDLESLVDVVTRNRVVTLIGVGGSGKTRLSIETATALAATFPDGCWLVQLAAVTTAQAVPFAFAVSLGISMPEQADVEQLVVDWLRHRRALLVVDNCEHVLDPAAALVERIASRCPAVTLLATSREPLMVKGEQLVPVPVLAHEDARQLFIDRAVAERPDLVVDDRQRAAIDEICERLDALPLAIELAASRVRAFTPVELAAMLDQRFRLLVGGRRSRMERHHTLRGTLDWSYELCTPQERLAFDRLSVFQGSFDLDGARAIATSDDLDDFDVIDIVPRLVDRSLLQRVTGADGGTRYRMLETMRAYGRDHLADAGTLDQVRHAHAEHIAVTVGAGTLAAFGPDERRLTARLIEYLPDGDVALTWLLAQRRWDLALHVTALGSFVRGRVGAEWTGRVCDAVAASGEEPPEHHEIVRCNARDGHRLSPEAVSDLAREAILGAETVPSTRRYLVPDIWVIPADASDAEQLLAALDRYDDAPAVTRLFGHWGALRSAAVNCPRWSGGAADPHALAGFTAAYDSFERMVADADSAIAHRAAIDLRGSIAMARGDWADAAEHFGRIDDRDTPSGWLIVEAGLNLADCRCRAGDPVSAADLAATWQQLSDLQVPRLAGRAATVTAQTLDALGHDDLAARFTACDPGDARAVDALVDELRSLG